MNEPPFRSLFDYLYRQAQSPELKEHIAAIRDSDGINRVPKNGKVHRAAHGAFTWIANMAKEYGEPDITRIAREMRDDNLDKFEEDFS